MQTETIAKHTRNYRKLHKWIAIPLFVFMFIIGGTGVLLGWKKLANLTPPTQKGSSIEAHKWIPILQLQELTNAYTLEKWGEAPTIDRIDVRPGKGVAKIIFEYNYSELQLDLATGEVLSEGVRYNDLIEHIHDGSIIDRLIGDGENFKVSYTTITSLGLMLLAFSGFWLWYNPKRIRKIKYHRDL